MMNSFSKILDFEVFHFNNYILNVSGVMGVCLTLLFTFIIQTFVKSILFRRVKSKKIDLGNNYALYKIAKYLLWIIAFGLILEILGISITYFLAGSAALLVGIGLGLQQTFNDFISGVILLSERSIKVGDILQIDGEVVRLLEIGLRTSKGLNRDDISLIIPNSLITTNKVINWTYQKRNTRFRISIGVAYGSDVELVMNVLKESVFEHKDVIDRDLTEVRFINFGNSSLDFQILFYSENIFYIEKIKSDIRKIINKKFIEHNIKIPFPQIDLHIRTDETKNNFD